jgi:hypothetical protein
MQSAANPIVSLAHLGYIGILIEMRQIERGNYMLSIAKLLSAAGVVSAMGWFAMKPDFAAVLLGILSLSALMITFLPVRADSAS